MSTLHLHDEDQANLGIDRSSDQSVTVSNDQDQHMRKRDMKQASKAPQENHSSNPNMNSVHEIYNNLEDQFENSHSIKSQQNMVEQGNRLCGTKRQSAQVQNLEGQDFNPSQNDDTESEERKHKRLVQNRKSAQKCRLKKKAEFAKMKEDVKKMNTQNKELKDKLNQMTQMLYNKIEENQNLHKKLEQNQTQHTVFLTKLLLNQQQKSDKGDSPFLQNQIQGHLQSYLGGVDLDCKESQSPFQAQLMSYLQETQRSHQLPVSKLEDVRTAATNTSHNTSPLLPTGSEPFHGSSGLSSYVQQILSSQKTQNVSIQELLKKVNQQKAKN